MKSTIEEMLNRYDDLRQTQDGYYAGRTKEEIAEENRLDEAIRSLILAVGEWKKRCAEYRRGYEELGWRGLPDLLKFFEQIRDFGEEGKE